MAIVLVARRVKAGGETQKKNNETTKFKKKKNKKKHESIVSKEIAKMTVATFRVEKTKHRHTREFLTSAHDATPSTVGHQLNERAECVCPTRQRVETARPTFASPPFRLIPTTLFLSTYFFSRIAGFFRYFFFRVEI